MRSHPLKTYTRNSRRGPRGPLTHASHHRRVRGRPRSKEEPRHGGVGRHAHGPRARARPDGAALDERVLECAEEGQVRIGQGAGVVGARGAEGAEGIEPRLRIWGVRKLRTMVCEVLGRAARLGPGFDRFEVGGDDRGEGEVSGDSLREA